MDLYICDIKLGEKPFIAAVLNDQDIRIIDNKHLTSADIIELRIDMFSELSPEYIVNVFISAKEKIKKPIIATVRDIKEGGKREIKDRLSIYKAVMPFSDVIDVEINSRALFSEIRHICNENNKLLIGSYHNFESTPDDDLLQEIVLEAKGQGADIVKIAVTANDREDLIRLLLFTLKNRDKGLITMSMGELGLPSRIVSPLFGSLISYSYFRRSYAPGQLSVNETLNIFRRLKMR